MELDYSKLDTCLARIWDILVEYQKTTVLYLEDHPKSALDSVGGTGKTLMALYATMKRRPQRVLIVCSSNALHTWSKELQKWFPELWIPECYNIVRGTKAQRKKLWTKDAVFYVVTYGTLRVDFKEAIALRPQDVLSDEYHRGGLKNPKSQGAKIFKQFQSISRGIIPMSGSGIRKGPQDLWSVLNILNPRKFSSYWRHVYQYCYVIDNGYGKEIGPCKNENQLLKDLYGNYIRIPRAISDAQKPKLLRQIVPLEMSATVKKHYRNLSEEMFTQFETEAGDFELIAVSTVIGTIIKLRKLLCCPQILGLDEIGPGIEAVLEHIADVDNPHCIIFTPFIDAIPIFKKVLELSLPGVEVMTLQGGDSPIDIKRVEETFRANNTTIAVVSCQFAESFELETAQYIHFVGYDWDQNVNEQCEWRAQRMTSDRTRTITAYYYMIKDTWDEAIMDTLNQNTLNVKNTFKSIDQLTKFVYGG